MKATEQKYTITNEHKTALEEQLDGMRMQKNTFEDLLEKEKNSKQSFQQSLLNVLFLSAVSLFVYRA